MTSKRDIFSMSNAERSAGREMWKRTGQKGRFAQSSFDAESNAPKTWILYANSKGEEIRTLECELYQVGRASDPGEAVAMLHGMCPKCGETFIAREDNKTMSVERVTYRHAPPFMKANWAWHCKNVLGRPVSESDPIPIVSSPERWACDYCKSWCVKVHAGVATDDHRGVSQITVHGRPEMIINPGPKETSGGVEL